MPSDRSRRTDDLRDGYKEVVAQQGRVILDRDFNAMQGLTGERIAADALDVVGPCGTPDDGFAILLPPTSPPSPPLWSPPGGFGPAGPQDFNFLISPGTMYVGGQRAVFPGQQAGHAVIYSYYDQPDWIDPPDPVLFESPPGANEFVYLDLQEQEVSAVEDPDLLEVALDGPDTTGRIKLMRRVKREAAASVDCAGAWQEAAARWLQRDGLQFDARTMRLEPVARLQVGFTQDVAATDPCDPVATGGYLGADNQLIRVQISHSGSLGAGGEAARLLWGYDNASFLYRITSVSPDGTMLTLAADPPDAFHIPQTGQLVEMLRTAAVLGKEPDETDPQRSILRVVAAAHGQLRRLKQPYGSITTGDPTKYIVLESPLDPSYATSATPLFLRVWQAELSFNATGDTVPLNDPATGASTGVQVTISVPPGEVPSKGAFWLLAMRPATPQAVYPERLLTDPQPPDGPRHWVCPLAVIDWQTGVVEDCRCKFDNLVTLTKRPKGCCTVSVSLEDLTATNSLQSIIDRAARLAQVVTVCLSPGTYPLSAPLLLDSTHSNMIIEACPGAVIIEAADPEGAPFISGLIVVSDASNVTLRGLQLQLPAVSFDLFAFIPVTIMIGINAGGSENLSVERCSFEFSPPPSSSGFSIIGAGVFLRGDCSGLTIHGCSFASAVPPTNHPPLGRPAPPVATPQTLNVSGRQLAGGLRARWEELQAQITGAGGPRAAIERYVVTVGCLAAPVFGPGPGDNVVMNGMLGDVCLRDNSFNNLGWAVVTDAYARTARLHDNNATQCVAGIWLILPDSGQSSSALYGPVWTDTLSASTEVMLLEAFIVKVPWPEPGLLSPPSDAGMTVYSLFLTNNQIEALPVSATSSAALVVLANRPVVEGQGTTISLVISGNRLRNQWPNRFVPTALIVVPDATQRSVVTSNLIFNELIGLDGGPSLYILPDSSDPAPLVTLFAVVGNALLGQTNLATLQRNGTATGNWLLYNSVVG